MVTNLKLSNESTESPATHKDTASLKRTDKTKARHERIKARL